jgi:hypothetical protein
MIPYSFMDARPGLSAAIVRRSESTSGGEWQTRSGTGWVAFDPALHLTPIDPPGTGAMASARTVWIPRDTIDGDCLAVFVAGPGGPSLEQVYNLLTPLEQTQVVIRTIGR